MSSTEKPRSAFIDILERSQPLSAYEFDSISQISISTTFTTYQFENRVTA